MTENDYEKFNNFFGREYSARCRLETNFETHSTAMHVIDSRITLTTEFCRYSGLKKFLEDINTLDDIREEEWIRRNNPQLQRAYEEYQILLKLTR